MTRTTLIKQEVLISLAVPQHSGAAFLSHAIFLQQTNLHEISGQKHSSTGNMLDIVSLVRYEKKPENSSGTCCAETMYVWTDVSSCLESEPHGEFG